MRTLTSNEMQFQVMDAQEAGIVAGFVLDEASARALFQTRSENLGNNVRAKVKEMKDAGKSPEEIQAFITEYDRNYTFSTPGAGQRRVVDPLEKECRALAVAHIREQLTAKGKKFKDVKAEKPEALEAKIDEISQHPEIVKLAKKRLADKRKTGMEDLELDL